LSGRFVLILPKPPLEALTLLRLGPARELLERLGMNGVAPVPVEFVSGERYRGEFFLADLDPRRVVPSSSAALTLSPFLVVVLAMSWTMTR
jgi:hypothetical protein